MKGPNWALVTGASTGIGRSLCDEFAAQGINVVLLARDVSSLRQVKREIEERYSVDATVIGCDLAEEGAAANIYAQIKKQNIEITYLVNNAGFGSYGLFTKIEESLERSMINVNITALTELCRLFVPAMIRQGQGRILNIASTAAFLPGPYMAVYFASKAYVLHLSEALSEELRGSGVTVTALCPGPTATSFAKRANATKAPIFRGSLPTAKNVAQYGYKAMMAGKPVVTHGWRNKLMIFSIRFMPRKIVARTVARAQS